jgi:hypothetical protein
MTLTVAADMGISPDDFDPPLKRTEAAVPGYWTVEELAAELGVTIRYVQYLIKGDPRKKNPDRLKAYRAGVTFLVADADALSYLWTARQSKKKS